MSGTNPKLLGGGGASNCPPAGMFGARVGDWVLWGRVTSCCSTAAASAFFWKEAGQSHGCRFFFFNFFFFSPQPPPKYMVKSFPHQGRVPDADPLWGCKGVTSCRLIWEGSKGILPPPAIGGRLFASPARPDPAPHVRVLGAVGRVLPAQEDAG